MIIKVCLCLATFHFPYPESDRRQSEGRFGGKRAAENLALSAKRTFRISLWEAQNSANSSNFQFLLAGNEFSWSV